MVSILFTFRITQDKDRSLVDVAFPEGHQHVVPSVWFSSLQEENLDIVSNSPGFRANPDRTRPSNYHAYSIKMSTDEEQPCGRHQHDTLTFGSVNKELSSTTCRSSERRRQEITVIWSKASLSGSFMSSVKGLCSTSP